MNNCKRKKQLTQIMVFPFPCHNLSNYCVAGTKKESLDQAAEKKLTVIINFFLLMLQKTEH